VFSIKTGSLDGKFGPMGTIRALGLADHIFLRLWAMAKIPNSQLTLSIPLSKKRLNLRFHLSWPKTDSGSTDRFLRKNLPLKECKFRLAWSLCRCKLGLIWITRSVLESWHWPRRGQFSHLCAWYKRTREGYPLLLWINLRKIKKQKHYDTIDQTGVKPTVLP